MRQSNFFQPPPPQYKLFRLAVVACALWAPSLCAAQAIEFNSLIVSVRSDAPPSVKITPDELLAMVNKGRVATEMLDLGQPIVATHTFGQMQYPAKLVIPADSALLKMDQYVTLAYNSSAAAETARQLLSTDARFGFVGLNTEGGFSPQSPANDEFYPKPFAALPTETGYQWGMQALNLAGAWYYTPGWGRVGVMESGPEVTHPDLIGKLSYFGSFDFGHVTAAGTFRGRDIGHWLDFNIYFHSTHVAGIILANANNPTMPGGTIGQGVSGACQGCAWQQGSSSDIASRLLASKWLAQWGAQVINLSGFIESGSDPQLLPPGSNCEALNYDPNLGAHPFCQSLLLMHQRDTLFVAASGNNKGQVQFPARDQTAIAVGGIDVLGRPWDETLWGQEPGDLPNGCPANPNPAGTTTIECGTNFGAEQDLVAPARKIVSTVPPAVTYIPDVCTDGLFAPNGDGYGYCTGTSMAAPHVSGIAGMARSIFPTLQKGDLTQLLQTTASGGGIHSDSMGYGLPNAGLVAERLLGRSHGGQLSNRLTPLFVLRNLADKDRLYTTNPTLAAAAVYGEYMVTPHCVKQAGILTCSFTTADAFARPYSDDGISIAEAAAVPSLSVAGWGGYTYPSVDRQVVLPVASFYVFTTPQNPFAAQSLLPLKKMLFAAACDWRDHVYATNPDTVNFYTGTNFCNGSGGYKLDGIEGYVMATCPSTVNGVPTAGCTNYADRSLPQPLFLRYSFTEQSYALLLGSQLSLPEFQSYQAVGNGVQHLLGYVFPNQDSDGDLLNDGQERLLGTSPFVADSDCDGAADGDEFPPFGVQLVSADPMTPGLCADLSLGLSAQILSQTGSGRTIRYTMVVRNLSGPIASGVKVNFTWAQRGNVTSTFLSEGTPDFCVGEFQQKAIPELPYLDACALASMAPGSSRTVQLDVTLGVAFGTPMPPNFGQVSMLLVSNTLDPAPGNNVASWTP